MSVPKTQKLYRVRGNTFESLKLEEAPVETPGPRDVLVRIRAVSLNYRDLIVVKQIIPYPAKENVIPVSDGAGEVVAIGEQVTQFKVGQRVAATFFEGVHGGIYRGKLATDKTLGGTIDGVLAQYRALPEESLVLLPDSVSFEQAATLPCAAVTAYNALIHAKHPLRASHTVLVLGTGGVSVLGAQIALASGARVIATSSSDDKLAKIVELGVKKGDTINYKTTPEWAKKVKELTNGQGVDHILEVGGPGTIQQSLQAVRTGGEIGLIGFVGGVKGEGLDYVSLLMSGASARGVLIGSREDFQELLATIANNPQHFKPVIDRVFPFTEAAKAYQHLENQAHFGKVVISVE